MKKNILLSLVLCFMFLLTTGIANAITLSERDELNNATPGTQKVGLGTILRSQTAVGIVVLFTADTGGVQTVSLSVEPSGDTGYIRKFTGNIGGESLRLGNGKIGQNLTLALVSDGGDSWTVTPDTSSGFKSILFADAGDVASLRFVDLVTGWVVVGTADVSSGPVLTAPDGTSDPGFK